MKRLEIHLRSLIGKCSQRGNGGLEFPMGGGGGRGQKRINVGLSYEGRESLKERLGWIPLELEGNGLTPYQSKSPGVWKKKSEREGKGHGTGERIEPLGYGRWPRMNGE